VADRLQEIFKENREQFEKKWDDLKLFITFGMISDEKFYERADKFALFKNTDGKYFTFEEYEKLIKENQTDKNKTLIYLYTTDSEEQFSYIDQAKNHGYDVLLMDGQLDPHLINALESKLKDSRFVRVDSDVIDKLIVKEDKKELDLSMDAQSDLRNVFEGACNNSSKFWVQFEDMGENAAPVIITRSEFMRRMKDMAAMGGTANFYGSLPETINMVVNVTHPLVKSVIDQKDKKLNDKLTKFNSDLEPLNKQLEDLNKSKETKKEEEIPQAEKDQIEELNKKIEGIKSSKSDVIKAFGKDNKLVKQLIDLALLANNMLKGEELSRFVKRSVELIKVK
jgi:molecular chaperone HtpG